MSRSKIDTGRWLRWLALAIIFSVACGFLANWQLNRREQVVKVIQRVERNYEHQRVRLAVMVPNPHYFKLSREYRRVWVSGSYLPSKTILVRNRPLDGAQGFEVITPMRLVTGKYILIDRGWVATGDSPSKPATVPKPSSKNLLAVGRLKSIEPLDSRSAPHGQILSLNAKAIAKQIGLDSAKLYTGAYLLLEQESIDAPVGKLTSKPTLDEGNHLSYAFQWVIFAIMAFIAIGWGIRQDAIAKRAAIDPNFIVKKRKKVGDDDKAAEDALLGE